MGAYPQAKEKSDDGLSRTGELEKGVTCASIALGIAGLALISFVGWALSSPKEDASVLEQCEKRRGRKK